MFNLILHGAFNLFFNPGVGEKNGPLPTLFPNHMFYIKETLHEDNVKIWTLVT